MSVPIFSSVRIVLPQLFCPFPSYLTTVTDPSARHDRRRRLSRSGLRPFSCFRSFVLSLFRDPTSSPFYPGRYRPRTLNRSGSTSRFLVLGAFRRGTSCENCTVESATNRGQNLATERAKISESFVERGINDGFWVTMGQAGWETCPTAVENREIYDMYEKTAGKMTGFSRG